MASPIAFINATTQTSFTGTEPTNTAQNDVMIGMCSVTSSGPPGGPAGWTKIGSDLANGTARFNVWYIVRGASAPALVWNTGNSPAVDIVTYRLVDTVSVIDVTAQTAASAVCPTVTPNFADELLLACYSSSSDNTATAPAGMTKRTLTGQFNFLAELALSAPAATGTKTWGLPGTTIGALSVTLAITRIPSGIGPAVSMGELNQPFGSGALLRY